MRGNEETTGKRGNRQGEHTCIGYRGNMGTIRVGIPQGGG